MIKLLFIGDIVGPVGCKTVRALLPKIKETYSGIDIVVANAENSAVGNGVSAQSAQYLFESGCDVLTGGNHSFRNFSIQQLLSKNKFILRPLNISRHSPGRGYLIYEFENEFKQFSIAIVNLIGQVFLDAAASAFETIERVLPFLKSKLIFIDFHAEATGEKGALAKFLDGKVSAIVGTHTHVQTNDARILKNGTGFLTDVGMVGIEDSVLGVKPSCVIRRMLTKLPTKFEVKEGGRCIFNAVLLELDENTGFCEKIKTIYEKCDI